MVQEKLNKQAANESRLEEEKRQLRLSLDEAENQLTKAELLRRSMDGEHQRIKMVLADKETETQARSIVLILSLSIYFHSVQFNPFSNM